MSITITETAVTYRYLMNRSKSDLESWLREQKEAGMDVPDFRLPDVTKDWMASRIMQNIRAAEIKESAQPQAFIDLIVPFGQVTGDADGKRWVFCGWGQTTVSREAFFVRELQPGERVSIVTPWTYHCTLTETLLRKFPGLSALRR